MEKYYIICSNNQAYYALINNAICSKAVTKKDFRGDTFSFLSNDYVFVTKEKPGEDLQYMGIPTEYYPIILEIEDVEKDSKIPARLVSLNAEGKLTISEEVVLSDYADRENCIGAFIMGDIPITYLSGILFDTEEHKTSFKKSSTDLWFPEDLFMLQQNSTEDFEKTKEGFGKIADETKNSENESEKVIKECAISKIESKKITEESEESFEGSEKSVKESGKIVKETEKITKAPEISSEKSEKFVEGSEKSTEESEKPFGETQKLIRDSEKPIEELKKPLLLSADCLKEAAVAVDKKLAEEEINDVRQQVIRRIRKKAALYYAIEGTENWNVGPVRTNVDADMIRFLDGDGKLMNEAVKTVFESIDKSVGADFDTFMKQGDPVFDKKSDDINRRFFWIIIKELINKTEVKGKVSEDVFNEIGTECMNAEEDKTNIATAFKTLINYLNSTMDPDKALENIGKYDVLRAFMLFKDQENNIDFLRRAATKLSQRERRYAYIMFGILNGMAEVERNRKSNRELEYRLEDIICNETISDHLIKAVPVAESSKFMQGAKHKDKAVYGIVPMADIWYDCDTSQKKLLETNNESILEDIYKLMVKSMKDDPIPEQDVYAFKQPVILSVKVGDKEINSFKIRRKKEAKDFGKKIEQLVKKQEEVFVVSGFRPYLEDKKRYQRLYRKNQEEIQRLCRKV